MATRNTKRVRLRDAIAMLKDDHQKIRRLFQHYAMAIERETRRAVANLFFVELETHLQLEEHLFYPAVQKETDAGPALVKASLREHQRMKHLIQELRDMGPDTKAFETTFHGLRRHVEQHVEEEEAEMFPLAEEVLAEETKDLRDKMQELKQHLLAP
jgi:hemerythrin-like domain-containing protein